MNQIKLFFTTFLLVFIAELGDKTQLAAFTLSAEKGKIWPVFLGSSIALIFSSLIAVIIGNKLNAYLNERVLKRISGFLFLGIGMLMLWKIF